MDEKFLETATIEELFQDYIKIYSPRLENTEKYKDLINALRDAFFAGMAIADVSTKSHTVELMMYIKSAKVTTNINESKEGWVN